MDTQRWKQLEALFIAALEEDAAVRPAFLDEACNGDEALRAELESMLSANDQSMALALEDRLLAESNDTANDPEDLVGAHIGPYRLEELIGAGGMGEVYLAQRDDQQYEQKVALKLVGIGYRSQQIMTRFRMERQVLARLSHPNITQLLDGGIDQAGRPYLVMQYVEGLPITEYCDKHALAIDERLTLFITVCDAVQHAHRNLVVHRDLKPSNILVTEDGVVKLLDFGIAKLLNPDWDVSVAVTRSQVRLMTPEYAAPEQVKGEPITTATDVYALGALLYEILSGRRPYQLSHRVQAEIERIICEVDPARPSTAITEASEPSKQGKDTSSEAVSRARNTGVNRLKKILQGDLDNIVLMALRKEPTRRYVSAAQLSEDISRYQNGLPVRAQKDAVGYRMQKFVRRHRTGVIFSALLLALLVGFSIVTATQSRLLRAERDTARLEKDRSEQVIGLLVDLFQTANPALAPGGDTLSIREFVKKGADKVLEDVADDEVLSIQFKHTLGRMYTAQGQFKEALALLEDAYKSQEARYGEDDSTTTAYMHSYAMQAYWLADRETAGALLPEILERNKRIFGPKHPRVAQSLMSASLVTADKGEKLALLEESLAMRKELLPANHMDIAESLNQLAIFYNNENQWDQAAVMFRESLAILEVILAPNHPNVIAVMNNLATVLNRDSQIEEAIKTQRDAVQRLKTVARDSSVQMANTRNNLAVLLTQHGDYEAAEKEFRHALGVQLALLGEKHDRVLSTRRSLAIILSKLNRHEEALDLMAQSVAGHKARPDMMTNKWTGSMIAQYGILLFEAGKKEDAFNEAALGLQIIEATTGENDPVRANGYMWWGLILMDRGALEEATPYLRDALSIRASLYEASDGLVGEAQCIYGMLLAKQGETAEALDMLKKGIATYEKWPRAQVSWLNAARQALAGLG